MVAQENAKADSGQNSAYTLSEPSTGLREYRRPVAVLSTARGERVDEIEIVEEVDDGVLIEI